MKLTPSSIISFLLLLVWSGLSFAAVLPDTSSNVLNIDTGDLVKRGCVQSKQGVCSTVPTVDDCVKQVKAHKAVAKLDSLFYSGMGGGSAIQTAMAWHKANAEKANGRGAVAFNGIVNDKWYTAQAVELQKQSGGGAKVDQFQKRLSQAFAQVANKKVYFFTAAGNDGTNMPATTAWGGWEYPALTRNPAVTEIIQVSMTGTQGTAHTIWRHGDHPSAQAPLG